MFNKTLCNLAPLKLESGFYVHIRKTNNCHRRLNFPILTLLPNVMNDDSLCSQTNDRLIFEPTYRNALINSNHGDMKVAPFNMYYHHFINFHYCLYAWVGLVFLTKTNLFSFQNQMSLNLGAWSMCSLMMISKMQEYN